MCPQQTSDLDTLLCRQDLDRLQKLDEDESERDAREQSVHMEDFFEVGGPPAVCRPQASFVSSRSQPAGNDDDVFLRPPLWEDITSSIQKLDPENADMLGSQSHVKMEVDDVTPPVLSPVEIKTEPLPPPPTLHLLEGPAANPAQTFPNAHPNHPSVQHHVVHHRTTTTTTTTTLFKSFPNNNNNNNNNNNSHNNNNNSVTVNSNSANGGNASSNNGNGGNNNGVSNNNNSNNNSSGSSSNDSTTSHHGSSSSGGGHQAANGNATTSPLYGSMTRLMYISPLTPPISDPGSPIGAGPPRRTPPPPYPQPAILNSAHRIQPPGSMSNKFNRRNNPELEKRRVHHCDFIGERLLVIVELSSSPSSENSTMNFQIEKNSRYLSI